MTRCAGLQGTGFACMAAGVQEPLDAARSESRTENDHGPVGARELTRFSYSQRALRWAVTAGEPWLPSSGWQRARSLRCTEGTALTRRVSRRSCPAC